MRDPRRELFAQKCAKSTQKPICEGADPFADLEDYTDELSICKSPSRHAKEVADRRLKSECSLHPTDDIQQEVGDVLVQGEDGACMKQLTQADPEMLSKNGATNIGGLPLATSASLTHHKSSRLDKNRRPLLSEGALPVNDMLHECNNKKAGGAVPKLADKDRSMRLKQTGRKKTSVEKPSSTKAMGFDDSTTFQGKSQALCLQV